MNTFRAREKLKLKSADVQRKRVLDTKKRSKQIFFYQNDIKLRVHTNHKSHEMKKSNARIKRRRLTESHVFLKYVL